MQTMTISQALAEVTLLNKKINKKIELLQPLVAVKATEIPTGFKNREDFVRHATSALQSTYALMENRTKLKCAILDSNHKTQVTMELKGSSLTCTVAEAVIMRETEMLYHSSLYTHCVRGTNSVLQACTKSIAQATTKADKAIETMLTGSDKDADVKEAMTTIQEQYRASTVLEPLGVENFVAIVDEMPQEHDEFLKTLDHTLSVSNATTSITI